MNTPIKIDEHSILLPVTTCMDKEEAHEIERLKAQLLRVLERNQPPKEHRRMKLAGKKIMEEFFKKQKE